MLTHFIGIALIWKIATSMDPDETKQMFKKFFIQSFLLHKKKSGLKMDEDDLIEIIKNLSNSKIIDDITNRLTGKVMRRISERLISKSQTDFSGENQEKEGTVERIEVILSDGHTNKKMGRMGAEMNKVGEKGAQVKGSGMSGTGVQGAGNNEAKLTGVGKKSTGKKSKGKKGKRKNSTKMGTESEEMGIPIMINGKFYSK